MTVEIEHLGDSQSTEYIDDEGRGIIRKECRIRTGGNQIVAVRCYPDRDTAAIWVSPSNVPDRVADPAAIDIEVQRDDLLKLALFVIHYYLPGGMVAPPPREDADDEHEQR